MSSSLPQIEEIALEKGTVGLGFNIRGGVDNIHVGNDPGIFVTTVKPTGAAAKDGRLQPGDKILEIDGNDLREVKHSTAVSYFHNSSETVNLLVERGAEKRIKDETTTTDEQDSSLASTADEVQAHAVQQSDYFSYWFVIPVLVVLSGSAAVGLYMFLKKRR